MKKILFIIFFFYNLSPSFAQKEGNIWCFGDSALIDWNDPQNPTLGRSSVDSRGSCTSIADSEGNLLFYMANVSGAGTDAFINCTDTFQTYEQGYIYNKNNLRMENGQCISGEGWYDEHTIIPMPGNDSLYYKFSVNLYDHPGIDYCTIDMKANGGLGKVIERDVGVITYPDIGLAPVAWFIKAIKHGNGRDWWVIAKTSRFNFETGDDLYFVLMLVSPEGISVQNIPITGSFCETGFSRGYFSQDGTKYLDLCPTYPNGDLVVYDFDRCTGVLSNQRLVDTTSYLDPEEDRGNLYWASCFSPNNRFLYVSANTLTCDTMYAVFYLLQYDLNDPTPALTKDTIDVTYIQNTNFYRSAGDLKVAPDGKIYYGRSIKSCGEYAWPYPDSWYHPWNMNLSVINEPDSAYPACNFTPYSFYLGGARTYLGLPNNPNFALGAVADSCNTPSALKPIVSYNNNELNIFPNPCVNSCQVQYKPIKERGNITIVNEAGKTVFSDENIPVTLLQHGYEINLIAFAKGIYFVTLETDKESVTKKMVKM